MVDKVQTARETKDETVVIRNLDQLSDRLKNVEEQQELIMTALRSAGLIE